MFRIAKVCEISKVSESEHHEVASTCVVNAITLELFRQRIQDVMIIKNKMWGFLYLLVIAIQPHSWIFWKCPEQDVAASPTWQTTLKLHQLCLSSHYQLWN